MSLVSVLLILLAPAPSPSASAVLPVDSRSTPGWVSSQVVGVNGELRLLPGWSVRVGPDGRAHLLGPTPRAPRAAGLWDDQATVRGLRVAVRVTARDKAAVYVEGRFHDGSRVRSFLLRWDAASGAWSEASAS
ncbi:MAG: hypothetical protein AAGI52_03630 [Bacteroidota bacterium]